MLLLVDDHQAEVLELDALAEQRVGADDDVDAAVGQIGLHLIELRGRHQPRGLRHLHREAAEAFGEGLEVLARQQRRRHHHRDLLAVDGGDEGRAQRHFGLAEADIAADQPVHRPAVAEILDGGVDGGELVVGLLVGKAGAEFVIGAGPDREPRRLAQLPLGRDLDQLAGDLADAALHARLARLPVAAAEPVELDIGLLGAVARQQIDVLDRQEQLGALGVMDFQAIVRRAGRLDRLQADEAADAVIDMHHQIAGGEAGRLGDEIVGAPLARRGRTSRSPRMSCSLTMAASAVSKPDSMPSTASATACFGSASACGQEPTGVRLCSLWSASTWLMRSRAPSLHSAIATRLPAACSAEHVLAHRLEHIGIRLGAFGGEIVAGARADIDHLARLRHRERRQPRQRRGVEPLLPFRFAEIEPRPAAAACRAASTPSFSASWRAS